MSLRFDKLLLQIVGASFVVVSPVSATAAPSLCKADEVTQWSCVTRRKIYSVCASADIGTTAGYLQYRVGQPSKVEFSYPTTPQHPKGLFHFYLGGRGASLIFSNAGYEYWLGDDVQGKAQINVLQGKRSVASVACASSSTPSMSNTSTLNKFKAIGIDDYR